MSLTGPKGSSYKSREACRIWAAEIVTSLQSLHMQGLLHYTWPFTVYALVNSLLIIWYDFSASQDEIRRIEGRNSLGSVIDLLGRIGNTWWAAAAKHKLAQALLRIGDRIRQRSRPAVDAEHDQEPDDGVRCTVPQAEVRAQPAAGPAFGLQPQQQDFPLTENIFGSLDADGTDFWPLLGMDLDSELAGSIYSIV